MEARNPCQEILEHVLEGVYFVDRDRTITSWNREAERLTGFTAAEVIGTKCYDNILNHIDEHGRPLCTIGCPLHLTMSDRIGREQRVYLQHKAGHRVPVIVRTVPFQDREGNVVGAGEVFIAAGNRVQLLTDLRKYQQMATEDGLTRVANRTAMQAHLNAKLSEFREIGTSFAVAFLDIDNFKAVNDTYGHDVGDQVLQTVANSLQTTLRKGDIAGRWGGEEFVVILDPSDANGAAVAGERLRFLIEQSSVRLPDKEVKVTVSVGCTLVRVGDVADTLVKRADEAMYVSKRNGKNRVTLDSID